MSGWIPQRAPAPRRCQAFTVDGHRCPWHARHRVLALRLCGIHARSMARSLGARA